MILFQHGVLAEINFVARYDRGMKYLSLLGILMMIGCAASTPAPATVAVLHNADSAGRALADYLEARHVRVTKVGGETRLEASGECKAAVIRFMEIARLQLDVCATNIANMQTTRDAEGKASPYRRRIVSVGPDGEVRNSLDDSPFQKRYLPGHPDADAHGIVLYSNVDMSIEYANCLQATQAYELAAEVLKKLDPSVAIAGVEKSDPFEESD